MISCILIKKTTPKLSLLFSLFLLTACGSNNDSSTEAGVKQSNQTDKITYSTVSGTAFAASALKDAAVTAICKDGVGFKNTVMVDAEGKWQGEVDSRKFPCRLEVKANGESYHSYVGQEGSVNINPFMDIAITYASIQMPAIWYQSGEIIVDQLKLANSALVKELIKKEYALDGEVDVFNTIIATDNPIHQAIQSLLEAIQSGKSIQDYNALLTLVKDGNLSLLPKSAKIIENKPPIIFKFNTSACQLLPAVDNMQNYNKCSDKVIDDFTENNLVDVNSDEKCILAKQNGIVTLTKGSQVVSALLDQEQEDGLGLYFDEDGLVLSDLMVNTGPYTDINTYSQVGLSFDEDLKLRSVAAKSPTVPTINCVSVEFKKQMNLN